MADKNFVIKNGLVVGDTLTIAGVELDLSNATNGQVLKFDGSKFASSPERDISGTSYSVTIGDNSSTTFSITHNFGTRNVVLVARNANSPYEVINVRWEATNLNTVTLDFGNPPTTDSVVVTIYSTVTVTNNGVTNLTGTANEILVSASTGSVTLSLPSNVTIANNLTVTGNLTVNGNTTTLNTETLLIEDNIIVLNSGHTGSPSTNAGIQVERGTSSDVEIRWNESLDRWEFTNDGTNYFEISNVSSTNTTFSGTITLPSTTSIGNVSNTEISYLDGVTSAIQTQINTKASTGKAIAMAIVFGG